MDGVGGEAQQTNIQQFVSSGARLLFEGQKGAKGRGVLVEYQGLQGLQGADPLLKLRPLESLESLESLLFPNHNTQFSTLNFQLHSIFHIENPKQIAIFAPNRQIKTKTQ